MIKNCCICEIDFDFGLGGCGVGCQKYVCQECLERLPNTLQTEGLP